MIHHTLVNKLICTQKTDTKLGVLFSAISGKKIVVDPS